MSNGIRVCMISEHASPLAALGGADAGGQNVYVAQLALNLAASGMSVDVFTRCDSESLQPVVEMAPGVRVVHVPCGPRGYVPKEDLWQWMPDFSDWMLRHCSPSSYDIIHANFWMSGRIAEQVAGAWNIPFVVTFHALGLVRRLHQGADDRFPPERAEIERRVMRAATRVIAECPQDLSDMVELYGAPQGRISVIPCGVDPKEMFPVGRRAARHELGIGLEEPVVLQVGRIVPRKGIDNVIRAVGLLRRRHGKNARLIIVGGETDAPDPEATPEIARLMVIAREEGVEDLVQFAGRKGRNELRAYYSAADVFVTTPWYEPFGITPLEAMACGTPVVGADVGGIRTTVVHGETGYLVPPRDPDALAVRLACLLGNRELARLMGKQAQARVAAEYTWPHITRSVAALYGEVLADHAATGARRRIARRLVDDGFRGALRAVQASQMALGESLCDVASEIAEAFKRGNKVLVCGNGGSAADAQHFAGELVGRYRAANRPGLPVISLTADSAVMTAWANDVGFSDVFARQVEAHGRPGDLLVAISTSGRSENVLNAVRIASEHGLQTVALTGRDGGPLAERATFRLVVPHDDTQHIQEAHAVVIHLLCDLVEHFLGETALEQALPQYASAAGGGQ